MVFSHFPILHREGRLATKWERRVNRRQCRCGKFDITSDKSEDRPSNLSLEASCEVRLRAENMTERLATNLAPTQFSTPEKKPFFISKDRASDITAYYSVENDISFLQKYAANLTPEERKHYVRENILGLLFEFAGKIPYRNITYLLGDKGLCYGDIRMIDMLQHTSDIAGDREVQENTGCAWVYQVFEDSYRGGNDLKHAAIISPPKNWDYGYIFYYEAGFDPDLGRELVRMHAIKYYEARHEIKNSQNILFRINPQLFYRNTREFLEFPVFDLVQTPDLDSVLRAAGVSKQDVEYSHWFEDMVMQDKIILYGMSRYIQLATDLASCGNQFYQKDRDRKLSEMEFLLRGMFNRAKKIKESYAETSVLDDNLYPQPSIFGASRQNVHPSMIQQILESYAAKPAVVIGGGSCPSISNRGSNGFLSSYQLSNQLSIAGKPLESLISGSALDTENNQGACSSCGKESDGHYHCPDCKKRYANETHLRPDQRTKLCVCGFKFNC